MPNNTSHTWHNLAAIEPRLAELERKVRAVRTRRVDWRQWSRIKTEFSRLVGWDGDNPVFASSACYDCAYQHLLAVFEFAEPEARS